jgi:hypothetical protein
VKKVDKKVFSRLWYWLVIANYYLAAALLLIAGVLKLDSPAVGELMEAILEKEIIDIEIIMTISRAQPFFEIALGCWAIIGFKAVWTARMKILLYLAFSLLILYVSEGYLTLPMDCGCFGEGSTTPVYLLLSRNVFITILLCFFSRSHEKSFVWSFICEKVGRCKNGMV